MDGMEGASLVQNTAQAGAQDFAGESPAQGKDGGGEDTQAAGMKTANGGDSKNKAAGKLQKYRNVSRYGGEPGQDAAQAKEDLAGENGRELDAEFERLIRDRFKDAFTRRTQAIINKRFGQMKDMQAQAERLKDAAPILEKLGIRYGIPDGDAQKILMALDGESTQETEEAAQREMSVPELRRVKALEQELNVLRREQTRRLSAEQAQRRSQEVQKIHATWLQDAQALTLTYPAFALDQEMQKPVFARLIGSGVDMKSAYEVAHKDEILSGAMAYTAQRVREKTARDIALRGLRPEENGMSGGGNAPPRVDVSKSTRAQRERWEQEAAKRRVTLR